MTRRILTLSIALVASLLVLPSTRGWCVDAHLVLRDEATLRLQWGTTGIAMKIKAPYRPE